MIYYIIVPIFRNYYYYFVFRNIIIIKFHFLHHHHHHSLVYVFYVLFVLKHECCKVKLKWKRKKQQQQCGLDWVQVCLFHDLAKLYTLVYYQNARDNLFKCLYLCIYDLLFIYVYTHTHTIHKVCIVHFCLD